MPLVAPAADHGRSSAIVAVSFLLGTVLGGLLAVLIGLVLGEGASTDAFLAAYSVYLVFLLFGSNLRVALLPLVGSGDDEGALRARAEDLLARIGATGMVIAVLIVVGAPMAGWLLTAGAQGGGFATAAGTLAILAPAAYCQIVGAAQSATLAAAGRFAASAGLYVLSSAATVILATGLMVAFGALGAALGVLGGASVLAAGHAIYLARFGLRGRPQPRLALQRASLRLTGGAAAGAALPLAFQLNLTIALGAVTGAVGVVTAYTYGYFVPVLLTSVTGASIGFVTMPGLVGDLERRGRAAGEDYVKVLAPVGAYLYVPLAVACAAFGRPVIDVVLGGSLSANTLAILWDVLRIFLLMGLVWILTAPAPTLALSLRRYRDLTIVGVAGLAAQAVAVLVASGHSPQAVAWAHAAVGGLIPAAVFARILGRDAPRLAGVVLLRSAPAGIIALVIVALAAVLPDTWPASIGGAALGLVLYVAIAAVAWPSVGGRVLRMVLRRA